MISISLEPVFILYQFLTRHFCKVISNTSTKQEIIENQEFNGCTIRFI